MSHEYIDFTSVKNRNRDLHIRRSFYSLNELDSLPAQNQVPVLETSNYNQGNGFLSHSEQLESIEQSAASSVFSLLEENPLGVGGICETKLHGKPARRSEFDSNFFIMRPNSNGEIFPGSSIGEI